MLLSPPAVVNEADGPGREIGGYDPCWEPLAPHALLWCHGVASRLYPSVNWVLPEGAASRGAIDFGQRVFDMHARRQARLLDAEAPAAPVAGTLHQALDRYDRHLVEVVAKHVGHATLENRRSQARYLKGQHADQPLAFLDLATVRRLSGHWTARPVMDPATGERYGAGTCKHRVSELSMFFDWLHLTDEFGWRKPDDFGTVSKTIAKDKAKRSIRDLVANEGVRRRGPGPDQRPQHRPRTVLLYLGLNCAFGAAETGRLDIRSADGGTGDLYLRQPHPLAHLWAKQGFRSGGADSWIAYLRPKTGVAGTWWLWPETSTALEAWLAVRPAADSPRLLVTSKRASLYSETSRNGQSTFNNIWTRLLKR